MLSAAKPARVTVGAAAILPVALRALSPAWATVEAAVRLDAELSAEAVFRTLSGSAANDELAVRLAVTLITTKRPFAEAVNARSVLVSTSTGGLVEPTTVNARSVLVSTSTDSFGETVELNARSIEPLTSVNTWAAAVKPLVEVKAALAPFVRLLTAAMLPDEARFAAPLNAVVDA